MVGLSAVSGAMFLLWLRSKEKNPTTKAYKECEHLHEEKLKADREGKDELADAYYKSWQQCLDLRLYGGPLSEKPMTRQKELPKLINKDEPYPYIPE